MPDSWRPAREGRSPCRDLARASASPDVCVPRSCFPSLPMLHLKRNAVHDPHDERGKAVIGRGGAAHDLSHSGLIVALQPSSYGVHQELLRQAFGKGIPILVEDGFESVGPLEGSSVRKRARRIDRKLAIQITPCADS